MLPKRLYISKLPDCISKSDIEYKFSHYGKVASVEVKHRKNGAQQDQAQFAYINLETSDEELLRCIRDFANKKWKGEFLDVQIAKESFLDRLKREREEEKSKTEGVAGTQFMRQEESNLIYNNSFHSENRNKRKKFDFDEHNESCNKEKKRKKLYFDEEGQNVKEDIIDGNLHLNGTGLARKSSEITIKLDEKDPKSIEADQKRKSSNIEKRNQFRQQKLQIRAALSNLDSRSTNKKIIFDESIENHKSNEIEKKNNKLFDESSDSEEDVNFELKPQFEGEEGHKLLQLQSKFKNDSRFVMDERFLENDNSVEENHSIQENEKEKQLSILEEVIGKKIVTKPKDVKAKQPTRMLRFNPDDPQHKAFEIAQQEEEKPATKKKKRKEAQESEEPKPEVSKSKFYKVSDDLKNVFQSENKSFTLFSADMELERVDNFDGQAKDIQKTSTIDFSKTFNNIPSDSEEEKEEKEAESRTEQQNKSASDRVRFWSEPFFFKEDDYRFQEGVDFMKRLGSQEDGDFLALRRNVKDMVRTKVKNVNKKKGMFKKKLGGTKKRMRMKKALKR